VLALRITGFVELYILLCGNLGFTRDCCLTQSAAPWLLEAIMGSYVLSNLTPYIGGTPRLVMALFSDGPYRATVNTLAADPLGEKDTVLLMILVGPFVGRYFDVCNDRSTAYGLTLWGDQAITETEGAEP